MDDIPQPVWDRIVRYAGREQALMKIAKRDWRFETARAYLNRLHHLYMCIRTSQPPAREPLMRQLRALMKRFEQRHMTKQMRHYVLMGQVLRKLNCTDHRRQRYVELYVLYRHLRKFINKPELVFYPYIDIHTLISSD